jgi:hypothetical protein
MALVARGRWDSSDLPGIIAEIEVMNSGAFPQKKRAVKKQHKQHKGESK